MSETVQAKIPRRERTLSPREEIIKAKRKVAFAAQSLLNAQAFFKRRKDELQALIDEHGDVS